MVDKWQPIETAPKNGEIIDVWMPNSHVSKIGDVITEKFTGDKILITTQYMVTSSRLNNIYWNQKEKCWSFENDDLDIEQEYNSKITHWMPLPEPPNGP